MESKLTKKQTKTLTKIINYHGAAANIDVTIRYDDSCGNGHNSFSITADIIEKSVRGEWIAGGCMHEEIVKAFPELEPYIKWHLTSSDEPMHYVANSLYFAREPDLEAARRSAIWPEAELADFTEENLLARLPALMNEFKSDVESLGFTY